MPHIHSWRLTTDLVLTLPDTAGWRDRLLTWQCPCGQYTVCHGSFHVTSRRMTLEDVEARAVQERKAGTPLARIAARTDRRTSLSQRSDPWHPMS